MGLSIENINVHGDLLDVVAIHAGHQPAEHCKPAIRVRFISLQAGDISAITGRQLRVEPPLEFLPGDNGKGAATDEHKTGGTPWMACGVGKCEHRPPGVAHENWTTAAGSLLNKVVQVFYMRRHRERLAAAASLVRLEHAPMLPQFAGEWRDVTGGSGSTV